MSSVFTYNYDRIQPFNYYLMIEAEIVIVIENIAKNKRPPNEPAIQNSLS